MVLLRSATCFGLTVRRCYFCNKPRNEGETAINAFEIREHGQPRAMVVAMKIGMVEHRDGVVEGAGGRGGARSYFPACSRSARDPDNKDHHNKEAVAVAGRGEEG